MSSAPAHDSTEGVMKELSELLRDPEKAGMAESEMLTGLMDELNASFAGGGGDGRHGGEEEDLDGEEEGEEEGDYEDEEDEGDYDDEDEDDYDDDGVYERYEDEDGRPHPVDLWREAHETEDEPSETKKLSREEWNELVARLNESAKRKAQLIAAMQIRREKEELRGARFTPRISKRSLELAAHNKRLPDRVQALMRRKKARLDKVREEKAQRELAEATFQPNLSKSQRSRAGRAGERSKRRVRHLLQYDVDKRIRAHQRRQIMMELEDRELTFSPAINPRSEELVRRKERRFAKVDRKVREKKAKGEPVELSEKEAAVLEGGLTEAALRRARARKAQTALAVLEWEVDRGRMRRVPLYKHGLSMLPGHEEETFNPAINPRSRAVRKGSPSKVYSRLYRSATIAAQKRREARADYSRQFLNTDVDVKGGIDMGVAFKRDLAGETTRGVKPTLRSPGGGVDPTSSPSYVNVIAYDTPWDFVVRRVMAIHAQNEAEHAEEEAAALREAASAE